MIIPKYWAEGRLRERIQGRQVTIRRFGWSDVSEADAQVAADRRAEEAMARAKIGETLHRRDLRETYGGVSELPIREEVISQHGTTVITRNSYGALCLNTPDVFFADVDFPKSVRACGMWYLSLLLYGVFLLVWKQLLKAQFSAGLLFAFAPISIYLGYCVAHLTARRRARPEEVALERINAFHAQHSDWHLRVYRSPAGFRILALHRTFDPQEPVVAEAFAELGVDPVYRRMCINQRCFRARLTAKPWRIGIRRHLRPNGAVWPINPSHKPERALWVQEYEQRASLFAACRYRETLGGGTLDPQAEAVRRLHDEFCRVDGDLPLA